jgi:hypothetical protein
VPKSTADIGVVCLSLMQQLHAAASQTAGMARTGRSLGGSDGSAVRAAHGHGIESCVHACSCDLCIKEEGNSGKCHQACHCSQIGVTQSLLSTTPLRRFGHCLMTSID